MRLIKVPLTISAPGATYTMTFSPPSHARLVVLGMDVDTKAAMYDHEVTSISHGAYEGITKGSNSGTDYSPPLGHVANRVEPDDLSSVHLAPAKFQPWPGRFNDPEDFLGLQIRAARGDQLSRNEKLRLFLGGRVPCRNFSFIPITPNVDFTVSLKRIYGASSVTYAHLWCLELDATEMEYCCSLAKLTDWPHWACQPLILAAGAGVEANQIERRWNLAGAGTNHALRVHNIMAMGYQNNGGVIAYAVDHLKAALVRITAGDGNAIDPNYADKRVKLHTFAPQLLQHVDCARRPEIIVPWNSSLQFDVQRLASTYQKDIRVTLYGLLRPKAENGTYEAA